jgi:hypothetical protein
VAQTIADQGASGLVRISLKSFPNQALNLIPEVPTSVDRLRLKEWVIFLNAVDA